MFEERVGGTVDLLEIFNTDTDNYSFLEYTN